MGRQDDYKYYKVPPELLAATYKPWDKMTPEERKQLVEERKQKVAALNARVNENVTRIQSSTEFRNFLIAMSRFHDYSFNNQMLIWLQRPNTTHVAGSQTWKALGRMVNKDESGIAILAPLGSASATTWTRVTDGATYAIKRSDKGWAIYDDNEMLVEDGFKSYSAAASKLKGMGFVEHKEILNVNNFKVVYVFDISQTHGKPLPEFDVPVLTGEANQELFDGLLRLAKEQNVTVSLEPMPSQDPGIKGFYRPPSYIWVRPEEAPAQQLKSFLHELAHHYTESVFRIPRQDAETIAESAACVVGAYYGFDTGVRSFPYIALWAKDEKVLKANLNSVQKVSERIIDTLEKRKTRLMPQTIIETSYERAAGQAFRLEHSGWKGMGRYRSSEAAIRDATAMGMALDDITLVESRGAYDLYVRGKPLYPHTKPGILWGRTVALWKEDLERLHRSNPEQFHLRKKMLETELANRRKGREAKIKDLRTADIEELLRFTGRLYI